MTPEESNLDYTGGRSLCTVVRGRGTLSGVPPELNTTIPHSARIYDFLLGGKDNFEADRSAAGAIVEASPSLPISMRANLQYMARTAHYLAAERGIRQFLDIGTGLPTSPNLHEVVQAVDPKSRVVYVDNDPIVLVHARALLTTQPEGATAYIDADLRDTRSILGADDLIKTLDLSRPVSVSLIAVLQFITEEADAHRILDELMAPMPVGSTLAISTVTAHNEQAVAGAAAYRARGIAAKARTDDEVTALFRGMDLVEPGVALVHRWRPDAEAAATEDRHVQMSGGVAVKVAPR
jgi:S-adenosyl methyltransferase